MSGHLNIETRRKIPRVKNVNKVDELALSENGMLIFLIQPNVETNSAEPKTAGITVEKLNDASKAYSTLVKYSFPTYCQLWI